MVNVQGMIVIPGHDRRVVAHRAVDPKELPEAGDSHQQAVAVFLHLKRLPFNDGSHGTLDASLLTHDAVDLFGVAVAERGKDDQVCG